MNATQLVLCELQDPNVPRLESYSPFCLKVHRALQLCRLPYQRRHASNPAAFKHYNPAAQVPVLLIDGEPVADSTCIVTRLDELSRGALSDHLGVSARAEAFLWEEMADTVLGGFLVAARWIDEDNWPRTKAAYFSGMPSLVRRIVPDRIRSRVRKGLARDVIRPDFAACWARFESILEALEARAPARGYWLGDAPSRADVAIFAQLFSFRTDLTPGQAASVAGHRKLSAWLERVNDACVAAATIAAPEPPGFRVSSAAPLALGFG